MAKKNPYCTYCLEPVNSRDPVPELQPLVQCRCGAAYHARCRAGMQGCLHCGSIEAIPISVFPRPVVVQKRKRATRIPAREVWGTSGRETKNFWDSLGATLLPSFQISRALIVAVILIAVSVVTGIFSYRVITLVRTNPGVQADIILDAILKASWPGTLTILAALTSGIVFGMLFYFPRLLKKRPNESGPTALVLFLGGVAAMVWLDIAYLGVDPTQWVGSFPHQLDLNAEPLIAEVGTAGMLFVLLLLYSYLAPITFFAPGGPAPSSRFIHVFSWLRFLVVSAVLVGLAGLIASGQIEFGLRFSPSSTLGKVASPFAASAWIAGLVLAALFYHPRLDSQPPRWVALIRVLVVLGGGLGWAYLYTLTPYASDFRQITMNAAMLIFIAIPLQRTLS